MLFVTILLYSLVLVLFEGVNGDTHPNLGLLPEECGAMNEERSSGSYYSAGLYEFQWLAKVYTDGDGKMECSGTVINQRYILLPAAAGQDLKEKMSLSSIIKVNIGNYDRRNNTECEGQGPTLLCEVQDQVIEVEEVIVHAEYSGRFRKGFNNIALLRLKSPIDFSRINAAPICLPVTTELQQRNILGQQAVIAGLEWKQLFNSTRKMLIFNTTVKKMDECVDVHSVFNDGIDGRSLCTGGIEGNCFPMAGGALMVRSDLKERGYRYVLYGIAFIGPVPCKSDYWTAYVNVSLYMDWILNNLKA